MAAAVDVLSDDLLRKILLFLPSPADLLRAALSCKHFLRAARDAAFLSRFRRFHPSTCPLLLGCLLLHPGHHQPPRLLPSHARRAATRAARGGDFSLAFLPNGGWSGDPWLPLDCRLLLKNFHFQKLALADPLSRRCVSLPAPPALSGSASSPATATPRRSMWFAFRETRIFSRLRALVLSSSDLAWAEAAALFCDSRLATSRAMQANRSLYWKLDGGKSMLAFSTATMRFSVLELPSSIWGFSFDVIEKGDEAGGGSGIHLLTMRDFCIEVWAVADYHAGGMTWKRVEKSVRFQKAMGLAGLHPHGPDVIGVIASIAFLRQWGRVFSINLETMKLRKLSKEDFSEVQIHPYAVAWPPAFLNPTEGGA